MKSLWAPWRMEYINGTAGREGGCIFCPTETTPSSQAELRLYSDAMASVLMNRFPYTNGHLLIAPRRHVADLTELTAAEHASCMHLLAKSVMILRQHLRPDGFNIGLNLGTTAGAGIAAHLHWHLVPRWEGDHNFMTVVGEIRTIPEHLSDTFARLLPDFQAITSEPQP